ncbi:galactosylceramide sulfotransferase-like [Mya arenaria]|uniref:galactosylceramide sulfotransferase-like n=1 Tax=Mya arenaria TaxID=6604 RepID=UPI0022E06625|nr:galactosylceramide sulfotransferase-like [Mya arenaria]XP_052801946.1 galactosylceramide sulfotransferase-like [Mya arenaria]XP_052801947.1 galactosylceramide sulfotransferase-like [Mya arenaria]XP_052801948.1 galactosylceramide sulfotransferase-like [Mya arenaria]
MKRKLCVWCLVVAVIVSIYMLAQQVNITMSTAIYFSSQLEEVRHIGFLKVHKAASSTMQNIFFRFGLKRNLTFVFTNHPNYFSRTVSQHLPLKMPRFRGDHDILCTHGIFNIQTYGSVLPKDATYIAIVREPLEQFVSSINYYSQPSSQLPYISAIPGNKLTALIRNPKFDKGFFSYTKNSMARDFGISISTNQETIAAKLTELNSIFKLVLLVEYFEESLILLKRYFKWKHVDILFISNNVHSKEGWSKKDLTPDDIAKFKHRNWLDYYVYDHFYEEFWRKFRFELLDIHMEVLYFKRVLERLASFCRAGNESVERSLEVETSTWDAGFRVNREECDLMLKNELDFISVLRQKQGSEL